MNETAFRERAGRLLQYSFTTEEFLDAVRDFAQEELFPIGLRLLSGAIDPQHAALAYSALAESIVAACLTFVETTFAAEHGRPCHGRAIVLALGKLGSREMTAASDLDLILIYDFDPDHPESDGPRPLHAAQYYTRIAQRLISALTAPTRRGPLYEVDMRLRPSGRQGPVATQFASFVDYQSAGAEVWEHMVLTRARVIAGDARLARKVERAVRAILTRPRGDSLRRDVCEMRSLIASAKGDGGFWDLKLMAGGLLDIEFLAQYLLLRHAREAPGLIGVSTYATLEAAGRLGLLGVEEANVLMGAHRLFTNVTQMLRLTLDPGADPTAASEAVQRRLVRAAELPSMSALISELRSAHARVRHVFKALMRGS